MLIWGYSTKLIQGSILPYTCSHCETMNLHVYGIKKVFEVFWIPCFPYKTTKTVICNNCGTHYDPDQFGIEAKVIKIKTPLKYFSGLVALPLLLAGAAIIGENAVRHNQEKTQAYLAELQLGDKIIIEQKVDSSFPYSIIKITFVDKEKVDFVVCSYNFSRLKDARKHVRISKNGDYETEEFSLTLDEIKALNIQDIIR